MRIEQLKPDIMVRDGPGTGFISRLAWPQMRWAGTHCSQGAVHVLK